MELLEGVENTIWNYWEVNYSRRPSNRPSSDLHSLPKCRFSLRSHQLPKIQFEFVDDFQFPTRERERCWSQTEEDRSEGPGGHRNIESEQVNPSHPSRKFLSQKSWTQWCYPCEEVRLSSRAGKEGRWLWTYLKPSMMACRDRATPTPWRCILSASASARFTFKIFSPSARW